MSYTLRYQIYNIWCLHQVYTLGIDIHQIYMSVKFIILAFKAQS